MKPLIKTLIFTVVAPATVTIYFPYYLSGGVNARFEGFAVLGFLPIVAGTMVYLRRAWDFSITGRGTPAPIDPPKTLVIRGLYRYVRNPMYVGIVCILIGESILLASSRMVVYTGSVFVLFNLFIVLYEEPALRRKFGTDYEVYIKTVSRWVPKKPAPQG